jgi:RHS repeat-associated protein
MHTRRLFSNLRAHHRARPLLVFTLVLMQAGQYVPLLAQSRSAYASSQTAPSVPAAPPATTTPPAPAGPPADALRQFASAVGRIKPNRRVPAVAPPVIELTLSASPTDSEISRARIFDEPLIPIGEPTTPDENRALAQALRTYVGQDSRERLFPLQEFLSRHPSSPWRASLMASFGTVYRNAGYFTRAAEVWDQAWVLAKTATDPRQRAVADYAVSQWLDLLINFGQIEQVSLRLTELEGRAVGGSAGQRIALAREGVWFLTNQHDEAVFSGTEAVKSLLGHLRGSEARRNSIVAAYRPPHAGMSLVDMRKLAAQVGLPLRAALRPRNAPIAVPSIVHLRSGHFSAVVEQRHGHYLLRDPMFGGTLWVSRDALEDEGSGYVLVPEIGRGGGRVDRDAAAAARTDAGAVADVAAATITWRTVSDDEADRIFGRCGPKPPNSEDPDDDDPEDGDDPGDDGGEDDEDGDGDNDPDDGNDSGDPDDGGPSDDNGGNDNGNDGGDTDGNPDKDGGKKPPCNSATGLAGYQFDRSRASLLLSDIPVGYTPPRGPRVLFRVKYNHRAVEQPQTFTYGNLGPRWRYNWVGYVNDQLGSAAPFLPWIVVTLPGSGTETYKQMNQTTGETERHWKSRAILVRTSTNPIRYERRLPSGAKQVFEAPDGGPTFPGRKVFLSDIVDSRGQSIHFTYDSSMRLVSVTDALGQVTTLSYELAADPLKVTRVTDPFGRFATFTYTASGRLAAITDVIGLTSSFAYEADDFISTLTTPYGKTSFRHEPGGQSYYRLVESTDPLGGVQRLEYHYQHTGLSATAPAGEVPTGFSTENNYLDRYVTLFWNKRAMALNPGAVSSAKITRWLNAPDMYWGGPTAIPQSIKRPLEYRIWFRYPGQVAGSHGSGTGRQPTTVARVLDDATSQIWQRTYNVEGKITSSTDPLGRERTYVYAANNVDLLEVRQTTGSLNDLLVQYGSYNAQHRPLTVTDAAGQTTTFTYNSYGQMLTATNALSQTSTYAYDSGGDGYLTTVTHPVSGSTSTYAYDDFGRLRSVTGPDGYATTTDYDALDRITAVTYPDGTQDLWQYERLNNTAQRDRLGRWTRSAFNAMGRTVSTQDELGRTTRLEWCACGALDKMIDPRGQSITWERDLRGRITREVRADGTTATVFTYETAVGRLKTKTDPKSQVTTFTYNRDNTVQSKVYTNATIATPSVSFTYDPDYRRVATMVDGTGTTTYTYRPIGVLGAGHKASIDGALANDTISFTYDELGRPLSRTVNGVTTTVTFDTLGRVSSETNALGVFTIAYVGATDRVASVQYPNGQVLEHSYYANVNDRRIQSLHYKKPGGATLLKLDYNYNAIGDITSWQQQRESDPTMTWSYGYSAARELVDASRPAVGATAQKRYRYVYDVAGNRTVEQIDDAVVESTYDTMNRLSGQAPGGLLRIAGGVNEPAAVTIQGRPVTSAADNTFLTSIPVVVGTNAFTITATDANGNLASKSYEVPVAGTSASFTHDANGSLTSDGTRTYAWDGDNRLVEISTATNTTKFVYNGLGAVVSILQMDGATVTNTRHLVWCQQTVCAEEDVTAGETTQFTMYGVVRAGQSFFAAKDHLRSTRVVTDTSGTILEQHEYGPYGDRLSGPAVGLTRTGYAGYYIEQVHQFAITAHRFYQPGAGRWLNEDPSRFRSGDDNLYRYVGSSPIRFVDPSGLQGIGDKLLKWGPVADTIGWAKNAAQCYQLMNKCADEGKACREALLAQYEGNVTEMCLKLGVGYESAAYIRECYFKLQSCQDKLRVCAEVTTGPPREGGPGPNSTPRVPPKQQ